MSLHQSDTLSMKGNHIISMIEPSIQRVSTSILAATTSIKH